jgi:DNA helicase-2/ATP-dependent DNA helicase PcrA
MSQAAWFQRSIGPSRPKPPEHVKPLVVGTQEQNDFYDLATSVIGQNIILEARAGTGKSTACCQLMQRLLKTDKGRRIRYATFSRALADEFREKAPAGSEVGTLHQFGLKAISRTRPTVEIDKRKSYLILDTLPGGNFLERTVRRSIVDLVSVGKNSGLNPLELDQATLVSALVKLSRWFDISPGEDLEPADLATWAADVLKSSAEGMMIDFDDMIWLPVIHGMGFPSLDDLILDEVQDLNPCQHKLILAMARSARTVAVGDPYQSIYAFRGADARSMPNLEQQLDPVVLPLTVSFRCPHSHVVLARQIVSDFKASDRNPLGQVHRGQLDDTGQFAPGDLVLCRSNAPLVKLCLESLSDGVPAYVRGRALGDQLGSIVAKLRAPRTMAEFRFALSAWKDRELRKLENREGSEDQKEAVIDRSQCLEAVSDSCQSPGEVLTRLTTLFSDSTDSNRITYSTIHRAKGSEANRVHYLVVPYGEKKARDGVPKPVPQWELDQRRNLEYVALTRSRLFLSILQIPVKKGK